MVINAHREAFFYDSMAKEKVSNEHAYAFRIKAQRNQMYPAIQVVF